jgi:hypothetical protein
MLQKNKSIGPQRAPSSQGKTSHGLAQIFADSLLDELIRVNL